jgi:hypothetical protein
MNPINNEINTNNNSLNFNDYISIERPTDEIEWFINRTPDYDLINNIELIRNIDFNINDDFIPFNNNINIDIKVLAFYLSKEDKTCCICMELCELNQICQLNCNHKFCCDCTQMYIKINRQRPLCPLCRTNITNISVQNQDIRFKFI